MQWCVKPDTGRQPKPQSSFGTWRQSRGPNEGLEALPSCGCMNNECKRHTIADLGIWSVGGAGEGPLRHAQRLWSTRGAARLSVTAVCPSFALHGSLVEAILEPGSAQPVPGSAAPPPAWRVPQVPLLALLLLQAVARVLCRPAPAVRRLVAQGRRAAVAPSHVAVRRGAPVLARLEALRQPQELRLSTWSSTQHRQDAASALSWQHGCRPLSMHPGYPGNQCTTRTRYCT